MKIGLGLVCSLALALGGEIPGLGEVAPIAQFGSVGVLTWVAWMLFGELRANRTERTQATAAIAETLTKLREHCAAHTPSERKD